MMPHQHRWDWMCWKSDTVEQKQTDEGAIKGERTRLAEYECSICGGKKEEWVRVG